MLYSSNQTNHNVSMKSLNNNKMDLGSIQGKNLKKLTKSQKFDTAYSKLSEMKLVTVGLASPEKIRQWTEKTLPNGKVLGRVTNANTLHHKSFKPQKGGLFCERIFGPLKDFECACGKIQKPTQMEKSNSLISLTKETEDSSVSTRGSRQGILAPSSTSQRKFCPTCDVEYTWSVIRRYQLGYIQLVSPVTHIWYLKGSPSYLSILLDMKKRHLEHVTYCTESLTLENMIKGNVGRITNDPSQLISAWKKLVQQKGTKDQLPMESGEISLNDFSTKKQKRLSIQPKKRQSWFYTFVKTNFLTNSEEFVKETKSLTKSQTQGRDLKMPLSTKEKLFLISSLLHKNIYEDFYMDMNHSSIEEENKASLFKRVGLRNVFKKLPTSSYLFFNLQLLYQKQIYISSAQKTWKKIYIYSLKKSIKTLFFLYSSTLYKSKENQKRMNNKLDRFLRLKQKELYSFMLYSNQFEKKGKNSQLKKTNSSITNKSVFKKRNSTFLNLRKTKPIQTLLLIEMIKNKWFRQFFNSIKNLKSTDLTKINFKGLTSYTRTNKKMIDYLGTQITSFYYPLKDQKEFIYPLSHSFFRILLKEKIFNGFSNSLFIGANPMKSLKRNRDLAAAKSHFLTGAGAKMKRGFDKAGKKHLNFSSFLEGKVPKILNWKTLLATKLKKNHLTVLKKLKKPFYSSLNTFQKFDLKSLKPIKALKRKSLYLKKAINLNVCGEYLLKKKQIGNGILQKLNKAKKQNESNKLPKLVNNIYSISHRERWVDGEWQNLMDYMSVPFFSVVSSQGNAYESSFNEGLSIIPTYKYRIFHLNLEFSEMNFSNKINYASYSGSGIIQQLLNEFDFSEQSKMDKQNRILLYQLNKSIFSLKKQIFNKHAKKELRDCYKYRDQLIRRTKLLRTFFRKEENPNSMILTILPVLPPDLRPIVKIGGQIAASDLNRLYQRVIYRNDRLKKFLKDPATSSSYEMKYAQRLLQEAVDNLIQNGKSGVASEKDARGRALKSLSDLLKGKQGRFRQYLLGKRVDYSGRSVIVVGPKLKLHECGLPKEMAIELYLPFLLKKILNHNYARTVVGAKMLIRQNPSLTWELLKEIMQTCPVLLNRAPTLHRLGIQAFQPKLIEGRAILLHPLVCPAFNADFDGDQMAVHVPITIEARAEAWKLMSSRNNFLSPATGDPLAIPSQDMVLGCYYLTTNCNKASIKLQKGTGFSFSHFSDVLNAYYRQLIDLHALVWVKFNGSLEQGNDQENPLEIRISSFGNWKEIYQFVQKDYSKKNLLVNQYICTTPGRILFNFVIQNSLVK